MALAFSHLHDPALALRRAKFVVPPPPRRLLRREPLVARIHAATEPGGSGTRVAIVNAAVGGGKTTLVGTAARDRRPGTVAWCTVDDADNDPDVFGLSILEAVLTSRSPEVLARAASASRLVSDSLDEALLIAGAGDPLLLVLDECDRLSVDATHAVRRLIAQAPPNLSIVILTNRDLPLSASEAARFSVLRTADLALSTDDVRELFRSAQLPLGDGVDETLTRWTMGHPEAVALAVAAYANPASRDRVIAAALRADAPAHIVLFECILDWLDAESKSLLLSSSIVDVICGDLAAAITERPSASQMVDDFARTGLFLDALPGCPGWYRHRRPSRDLLAARLLYERRADVAHLQARAARWFAAHGLGDRALTSAGRGDDRELLVELVRDRWIARTLDETDAELDAVPTPSATGPRTFEAALADAAIDIERGEPERASQRVDAAAMVEVPARRGHESLFEALLRLRIARDAADAAAVRVACAHIADWCDANRATSAALAGDVTWTAERALAEASLIEGNLEDAAQRLDRVYKQTVVVGRKQPAAAATAALAVVTALAGRVRSATALIGELGDTSSSSSKFLKGVRATAVAICEYHGDNLLNAQVAVSEARKVLRPGVYRDVILQMVRARLKASIGDEAGARRIWDRASTHADTHLLAILTESLGLSPASERDAASTWVDLGGGEVQPYQLARSNLRRASRCYMYEQMDDAWDALEQALALVQRHSYRRIALDSGDNLRPLLRDYVVQTPPFGQTAWQLLQRLPNARTADDVLVVETLTERELAVLQHLPTMKSNHEIAAEMFFSVNTIKTHLKSIYRKLGVNRRRDAVDEARARLLL